MAARDDGTAGRTNLKGEEGGMVINSPRQLSIISLRDTHTRNRRLPSVPEDNRDLSELDPQLHVYNNPLAAGNYKKHGRFKAARQAALKRQ